MSPLFVDRGRHASPVTSIFTHLYFFFSFLNFFFGGPTRVSLVLMNRLHRHIEVPGSIMCNSVITAGSVRDFVRKQFVRLNRLLTTPPSPDILIMANTRDSETPLWFDDGNVILRSGDTMHRVHRSIVGRHSAKLRRIFEIRKEVNGDYESPPVLFVTDNADNLLHYVRARYNEDRFVSGLSQTLLLLTYCRQALFRICASAISNHRPYAGCQHRVR